MDLDQLQKKTAEIEAEVIAALPGTDAGDHVRGVGTARAPPGPALALMTDGLVSALIGMVLAIGFYHGILRLPVYIFGRKRKVAAA